jgi:UDP-N-acetylglucosamine 3-dehydrogenase
MSQELVRFGFLGAGSIVIHRHALELADNPYAELVAVYDPVQERAEYLAEEYGMLVASSEDCLINNKDIDAIVVATPNSEHARLTVNALKAGKHVLCEKPMATSLEDAAAMIKAAEKSGKKLMIGHNQCLMAPHLKAKQLLNDGVIGDVLTFRSSFGHGGPETWSQDNGAHTWFFKKEKAYVGSMGDLGVHKAYLLPWLLGADFSEAAAFVETKAKRNENDELISVDDNAICILKMENGIMGQLTASWTYGAAEDNVTIIYGTKGQMVLGADPDYQVEVMLNNGEVARYKVGAVATNVVQVSSGIPDLFVDCILDDFEPPFDGIKGYKALATVVACMESADSKKVCQVQNELPC